MATKNGSNNQPPKGTGKKTPFRESNDTGKKGTFIRDDTAKSGGTTNSSGPRKTPEEKK